MSDTYKVKHIEYNDRVYLVEFYVDDHMGAPWKEWQEAMKIARRDGWGKTRAECVKAVEADFKRLSAWVNDEWHWMVIHVQEGETCVARSIGGVESDVGDEYVNQLIIELIDEMGDEVMKHLIMGTMAA